MVYYFSSKWYTFLLTNIHLVCEVTLKVIEKRMQQSKALIFVNSDNSKKSIWCIYELNYFSELEKPIYIIEKMTAIKNCLI